LNVDFLGEHILIDNERNIAEPGLAVGAKIGPSDWVLVTQEMISGFARYTLDPDPLHMDPKWAEANSPYGVTIAFGFLTVSLLTHLMHSAQGSRARDPAADPAVHGYYLNYGFNRLRLISPVKVDSRVRGHFIVKNREVDDKGRDIATFDCLIEIEGEQRPALVAEWLAMWIPGDVR
jgi:acyl dehydratase